jgi:hypothetical protein
LKILSERCEECGRFFTIFRDSSRSYLEIPEKDLCDFIKIVHGYNFMKIFIVSFSNSREPWPGADRNANDRDVIPTKNNQKQRFDRGQTQ